MTDARALRAELDSWRLLQAAIERLASGFESLPGRAAPGDTSRDASGEPAADSAAIAAVLDAVARRLHDNYPYFHPLYAGQMLKPPHPVARLAYALAMNINPNNHALDGGRASSALEKDPRILTAFAPQLDIVVWAPRAPSVSRASALSRRIFDAAAGRGLHLALAALPTSCFDLERSRMTADRDTIVCLRSVLMKPEHRVWVDRIGDIVDQATTAVLSGAAEA